jgi:hypothetical protein
MSASTETGHSKNVANFESLISFCTGYGKEYNPSNENLTLPALLTLFNKATAVLQAVKLTQTAFDNTTNSREIGFDPLKGLCTRIVNALAATQASAQTLDDAKTINRKIHGRRADNSSPVKGIDSMPVRAADGKVTAAGADAPPAQDQRISVSQQGFDNLVDHFTKIIQHVSAEPLYKPNENDLKVEQLNILLANLKTANSAAIASTTEYSNARIARDTILYKNNSGLVDIANAVKKYVKSVFGATSPQYKQIGKLHFKKRPQ